MLTPYNRCTAANGAALRMNGQEFGPTCAPRASLRCFPASSSLEQRWSRWLTCCNILKCLVLAVFRIITDRFYSSIGQEKPSPCRHAANVAPGMYIGAVAGILPAGTGRAEW